MIRTILAASAVAIASFGTAHAAGTGNPLEPSYYQGQPAAVVTTQGTAYVDVANPLVARHYEGRVSSSFEGTASRSSDVYRDTANPLNPSHYVR